MDTSLFFLMFTGEKMPGLISLQALFGHFFKGLIDHLVLNHKQLLSMERENHKVQSINVPVDGKSFVWSQYPCEA